MKDFKYKTSFSSVVRPLVSEERDKYLAEASLERIGRFIPDIDTDKDIDLLPIAFNACVVNRANKNGDVMDTKVALAIYKNFINKPINIEHNRNRVVGVILTAGFSEFGTDTPLTEEEVKDKASPFNITLGGVIWKIANEDLASLIEESSDPSSEDYMKVSASWELGFSEYNIVKVTGNSKNTEDGEVISDEENIEKLKNNLKSLGGNGKIDDDYVYRLVTGEVVPLGIGLTESPAADVKGVATKREEDENFLIQKNKSSQDNETNVINEENYTKNNIVNNMKITSLNDITNESLKTMEASMISDFIQSELKKKCEEYETEQSKIETHLEESKKDLETVSSENNTLKSELDNLKNKVGEMEAQQAAQAKEAAFNERMASLDEEYELDDDTRKVIVEQLKAIPVGEEDEAYSKWQATTKVLLKRNSKEFIAKQEKISATEEVKEEEVKEETKTETVKEEAKEETVASTSEADAVVEEAIENAEKETGEIPNTSSASEPTLLERYQEAFNLDQSEIKY